MDVKNQIKQKTLLSHPFVDWKTPLRTGTFSNIEECGISSGAALFALQKKKYNITVKPVLKKTKIGFQDRLWLNAGQKYCRMLQREQSAIISTFVKLPVVIKICVLSVSSPSFRGLRSTEGLLVTVGC